MAKKIEITEESLYLLNIELLEYVFDDDEEKIEDARISYLFLNNSIMRENIFEECYVNEDEIKKKFVYIKHMTKRASSFFDIDFHPAFLSKKNVLGQAQHGIIGINISLESDIEEIFKHELVHALISDDARVTSKTYKELLYKVASHINKSNFDGLSSYCANNLLKFKKTNNCIYGEEVLAEVLSLKKADPELARYAGICFDNFRDDSLCWNDLSLI